jgi:hypothetical protein
VNAFVINCKKSLEYTYLRVETQLEWKTIL